MSENFELPVSIEDLAECGCYAEQYGGHLSSVLKGMRFLCTVGFASEDVADAIYSNPAVLHALEDGDYLGALDLTASRMTEALATVRRSGIGEDRLWLLTEAGLALGEISWAIGNIGGFKDNMTSLSLDAVKTHAESTYEFFRNGRSTRRVERTTRWGPTSGGRPSPSGVPKPWFDHYSKIIGKVARIRAEIS